MELRHLRYFLVVAEELHFGRAASRLHIDASPLSRAIKELEAELGVQLFERDTRRTRITRAGSFFLQETRRLFAMLEQARTQVRAVAMGLSTLRIGFSAGLAQPRLAEILTRFRSDEPDIDIRIVEMPLAEQLKNLRSGWLDVGLVLAAVVENDLVTESLWRDPVVAVLPAQHPMARRRSITLADLADQPLVLCHPDSEAGCYDQIDSMVRHAIRRPRIAEYAATAATSVTLIASGFGIGFMSSAEVAIFQRPDIAIRPLAGHDMALTTYLLRPRLESAGAAQRFIQQLRGIGQAGQSSEIHSTYAGEQPLRDCDQTE